MIIFITNIQIIGPLNALKNFVNKHNCKIFNAEEVNTHGGSIRVYVSKNLNIKPSKSVNVLLKENLNLK